MQVGNSSEVLLKWYEEGHQEKDLMKSSSTCSLGILQAMAHFGFEPSVSLASLPAESLYKKNSLPGGSFSLADVRREVVSSNILLEKWLNGELKENTLEETLDMLVNVFLCCFQLKSNEQYSPVYLLPLLLYTVIIID